MQAEPVHLLLDRIRLHEIHGFGKPGQGPHDSALIKETGPVGHGQLHEPIAVLSGLATVALSFRASRAALTERDGGQRRRDQEEDGADGGGSRDATAMGGPLAAEFGFRHLADEP